jgi:hypothetical protein
MPPDFVTAHRLAIEGPTELSQLSHDVPVLKSCEASHAASPKGMVRSIG